MSTRPSSRKLKSGALTLCTMVAVVATPLASSAQERCPKLQTLQVPKPIVTPPPADVAAPPRRAQKTASGLAMKVLKPGSGSAHPTENDCVRVTLTGWRIDGSLFSSSPPRGAPHVQCLSSMMPGLVEALEAMTVGEKRRVWVPASLTVSQKRMDQTPTADLTFDVHLTQIVRAPPLPKDLKDPPKKAVNVSPGSVLRVLKKGSGARHPVLTSEVMLHVSGWTSEGKLFQSTVRGGGHPAMFVVGDAPAAWREALQHMVVGDKVRLWVNGSDDSEEKAGENLVVYEIELLALR
jgi:FKBP-type peptidyl-prolyl cis-trans isomerase